VTTFFLIRHGANDFVGEKIAGRMPDVHLNAKGKQQAERLAEKLSRKPIQKIFSSPLERAIETAEPLAKKLDLKIQISDAFNEIDFGDWTGLSLEQLAPFPKWQQWNSFRSGTRIPNGELIVEVQSRMVKQIELIRREFPNGAVAIFGHGDPIKSALFYFLGLSLDSFQRIEISPASVSELAINDFTAQVLRINAAPHENLSPIKIK
jgi:probable phosphoglycerate mutase